MQVYRDVLKIAWRELWKHPWLLFFGFFAALSGSTGEYRSVFVSYQYLLNELGLVESLKLAIYNNEMVQFGNQLMDFLNQPVETVLLAFSLILAVLVGFFIVTVSQAALIEAAGTASQGEAPKFKSGLMAGIKNFWSILWLNMILKFAVYLLLIVGTMPFLIYYLWSPSSDWSFYWIGIIAFIIFIPLALILNFVLKYAMAYIVLKGDTWWQGLERGLNLFLRNWLVSLEMAAVLFAIFMVLGMVLKYFLTEYFGLRLLTLAIDFRFASFMELLPTLAVVVFVGATYGAYQYLAWIFLFEKLDQGQAISKLQRLTGDVPEYLDKILSPNTKN